MYLLCLGPCLAKCLFNQEKAQVGAFSVNVKTDGSSAALVPAPSCWTDLEEPRHAEERPGGGAAAGRPHQQRQQGQQRAQQREHRGRAPRCRHRPGEARQVAPAPRPVLVTAHVTRDT